MRVSIGKWWPFVSGNWNCHSTHNQHKHINTLLHSLLLLIACLRRIYQNRHENSRSIFPTLILLCGSYRFHHFTQNFTLYVYLQPFYLTNILPQHFHSYTLSGSHLLYTFTTLCVFFLRKLCESLFFILYYTKIKVNWIWLCTTYLIWNGVRVIAPLYEKLDNTFFRHSIIQTPISFADLIFFFFAYLYILVNYVLRVFNGKKIWKQMYILFTFFENNILKLCFLHFHLF